FYVPIIPIVSVFSPPSVHHGGYLAHKHKTGDVFYVEGAVDVTSALQDPTLGVVANIVPVEAGATSPVLTASCVEALEACIARWVALDAEVRAIQVHYANHAEVRGTVSDGTVVWTWRMWWWVGIVVLGLLATLVASLYVEDESS